MFFCLCASAETTSSSLQVIYYGDLNYPPYEWLDKTTPVGFNIELIKAISRVMGLDLKIRLEPWPNVLETLQNSQGQAMVACLSRSQERTDLFDFSMPFTIQTFDLFIRKEAPFRSAREARDRDILVHQGGIAHRFIQKAEWTSRIMTGTSDPEILKMLSDGHGDMALMPKMKAMYLIKHFKLNNLRALDANVFTAPLCYATPKGQTQVLSALNEGLASIKASGEFDALYEKWFGLYEAPIPPAPHHEDRLKTFLFIVIPILCAILLMLSWPRVLRRQVASKTRELQLELRERIHAEIALRAEEEKYRTLVTNLNVAVFRSAGERTGVLIEANMPFVKMLGFETVDDLMQTSISNLYDNPDDRTAFLADAVTQKSIQNRELRFRRKDGTSIWVSLNASAQLDDRGNLLWIDGIIEDISERKEAEAVLLASQAQLNETLYLAKMAYWVFDTDKQTFIFDDSLLSMLGTSIEREGGHLMARETFLSRFIHPEDATRIRMAIDEAVHAKDPDYSYQGEARQISVEGTIQWIMFRFRTVQDEAGHVIKLHGGNQNITEQKHAEEQANRQMAFDALFTGILARFASCFESEIDDHIRTSIGEIGQFMGIDQTFVILISPTETAWGVVYDWAAEGSSEFATKYRLSPVGTHSWSEQKILNGEVVQLNTLDDLPSEADVERCDFIAEGRKSVLDVPLRGRGGKIVGCIGAVSNSRIIYWSADDIRRISLVGDAIGNVLERKRTENERSQLEEQFRQSQKMESVGRLAGGVAHDFNNMLAIILGHGELLLEELHPEAPMREEVDAIVQAGERAKDLTRQLLAFSRKQVLNVKTLDLNEVVHGMEKMLKRLLGEDIAVRVIIECETNFIKGDISQLEQVLMNLCVNARDAMMDGGKLTIEVKSVFLDEHYVGTHPDIQPGPYILLTVSDTGCGMDETTRQQVFDPFFTTKGKGKGTGLGLATVYGIVKQHGGDIRVYSEPGSGTTFRIYLPQVQSVLAQTPAPPQNKAIPGQGESILVVEDEESVRTLACRMLVRLGYKVIEAHDVDECLKLAQETPRIDLLLTDVIMPGMNGRQVYEHISTIRPGVKALFMSGYTEDLIAHHGILDTGIHFIPKPFTENGLSRKIRDVLNS